MIAKGRRINDGVLQEREIMATCRSQRKLGNKENDTLLELYRIEMFDLGKYLQPVGPRM